MGEQLLVAKRENQRLVIVRPSIIESSLSDPEPGWIRGMKVMDPLVAAYGRGLLPDFAAGRDLVPRSHPVDIVVNATLAAATQAFIVGVPVFQVAPERRTRFSVHGIRPGARLFSQQPDARPGREVTQAHRVSYPSLRRFRLMIRLRYLIPLRAREWFIRPHAVIDDFGHTAAAHGDVEDEDQTGSLLHPRFIIPTHTCVVCSRLADCVIFSGN